MKFNNRNVFISPSAKIGENVKIGDNSIIYDYVEIGDNSIICNDCVIGEPLNSYYSDENYKNPALKIGANSLIKSHCIIYAGSEFGNNLSCGHRVTIRENVIAGEHLSVGTLSEIQEYVTIGNNCRFQSNVHIGQRSTIGNFVRIYPYAVLTNDPPSPSIISKGATIGDYTIIAVHSDILPMAIIGKNCLVGANTTVNRNFNDESIIVGSPAKSICSVKDIESLEKEGTMHYPWMSNYKKECPWEGIGYYEWQEKDYGISINS
jgi:UDP-3-O-[3-hydroxymyristoyl] glucosamine N-acyltransferase